MSLKIYFAMFATITVYDSNHTVLYASNKRPRCLLNFSDFRRGI